MIKLEEFKELKLSITWTLIDIGYKGSDLFQDELTSNDIIEYAISLLDDENYFEEVAELAGVREDNTEVINNYIKILSAYENCDKEKELKKWVVCYVNKIIQKKYDNCIDGLMELGDILLRLGMPEDSPHLMQGVNNDISPKDYYTMKNYEDLYESHIIWVEKELLNLR